MYIYVGFISLSALGSIAAIISAIATCVYTYFTYQLLRGNNQILQKNNKLAEYKVYVDFDKKFSSKETLDLLINCRNHNVAIDTPQGNSNSDHVTGYEVRKDLLDILEDLSKFYQDGLISLESIDSGFGYNILYVGNNYEIRRYINDLRKFNPKIYSGFEILYLKILEFNSPELRAQFNDSKF